MWAYEQTEELSRESTTHMCGSIGTIIPLAGIVISSLVIQSFIGSLSLEPMVHGLSMVRNRKIIVLSCMCLCFCMSLYVSMKTHIAHCVHRQISIEIYLHACTLSHFSHVWLFLTLWIVAHQAPLSLGFSRQEHWGGLPCPGIEPVSFMSPALAGRFFTTSASWEVP